MVTPSLQTSGRPHFCSMRTHFDLGPSVTGRRRRAPGRRGGFSRGLPRGIAGACVTWVHRWPLRPRLRAGRRIGATAPPGLEQAACRRPHGLGRPRDGAPAGGHRGPASGTLGVLGRRHPAFFQRDPDSGRPSHDALSPRDRVRSSMRGSGLLAMARRARPRRSRRRRHRPPPRRPARRPRQSLAARPGPAAGARAT